MPLGCVIQVIHPSHTNARTSRGFWANGKLLQAAADGAAMVGAAQSNKSRKLAMLAGVPLALARNMPGAGPADLLILSLERYRI